MNPYPTKQSAQAWERHSLRRRANTEKSVYFQWRDVFALLDQYISVLVQSGQIRICFDCMLFYGISPYHLELFGQHTIFSDESLERRSLYAHLFSDLL